ncbi:MAG: ribonuclease P protein component [Leptolyngbyaceae cyanobacterium RU_5_1]|nr:ribonuclease P protein component [Leptolyngbyaceae cyanobacterium RU_5_1]
MGLPKVHRLKRRQDFNLVYQKGTRFKTSHLTLRVLRRRSQVSTAQLPGKPFNPALPTRLGISISLKVDKRAVVRNRIRRQLQAIFRQFLPRIVAGWDLIVVVHPQAAQCDYLQFLQELEQLLVDAEVLNGYS